MPNQLLAYMRLSRLQDPGELVSATGGWGLGLGVLTSSRCQQAKVSFLRDSMVSQSNEYEILMLVMADMRERLQAYELEFEEERKLAQQLDRMGPEERLACLLRLGEKRILMSTMDAVRKRLAPIRGIPTKSGALEDPNQDLRGAHPPGCPPVDPTSVDTRPPPTRRDL